MHYIQCMCVCVCVHSPAICIASFFNFFFFLPPPRKKHIYSTALPKRKKKRKAPSIQRAFSFFLSWPVTLFINCSALSMAF